MCYIRDCVIGAFCICLSLSYFPLKLWLHLCTWCWQFMSPLLHCSFFTTWTGFYFNHITSINPVLQYARFSLLTFKFFGLFVRLPNKSIKNSLCQTSRSSFTLCRPAFFCRIASVWVFQENVLYQCEVFCKLNSHVQLPLEVASIKFKLTILFLRALICAWASILTLLRYQPSTVLLSLFFSYIFLKARSDLAFGELIYW